MAKMTADDIAKRIRVLERQLFTANTHFETYIGIARLWSKHAKDVANTPVFWNFTMQAHIEGAVTYLCRVYDTHSGALHLPALLNTIERHSAVFCEAEFRKRHANNSSLEFLAKQTRVIDPKQISADKKFCSREGNTLVKNLRQWRNKVIAHLSEEHVLSIKPPLSATNPLPFDDIKTLIETGYDILNRYSSLLDARHYSMRFASPQNTDYTYLLGSLRYARVAKRWNDKKRMMRIKKILKNRGG
jgi:hypothetical protein